MRRLACAHRQARQALCIRWHASEWSCYFVAVRSSSLSKSACESLSACASGGGSAPLASLPARTRAGHGSSPSPPARGTPPVVVGVVAQGSGGVGERPRMSVRVRDACQPSSPPPSPHSPAALQRPRRASQRAPAPCACLARWAGNACTARAAKSRAPVCRGGEAACVVFIQASMHARPPDIPYLQSSLLTSSSQ